MPWRSTGGVGSSSGAGSAHPAEEPWLAHGGVAAPGCAGKDGGRGGGGGGGAAWPKEVRRLKLPAGNPGPSRESTAKSHGTPALGDSSTASKRHLASSRALASCMPLGAHVERPGDFVARRPLLGTVSPWLAHLRSACCDDQVALAGAQRESRGLVANTAANSSRVAQPPVRGEAALVASPARQNISAHGGEAAGADSAVGMLTVTELPGGKAEALMYHVALPAPPSPAGELRLADATPTVGVC